MPVEVIGEAAIAASGIPVRIADLFSVAGKVALVTGGTRGIGRMIAQALVDNGARTYIASRHENDCREAAQELGRRGECIAVAANLATAQGIRHLSEALRAREPALHVLVNNAGANWGAAFEAFPEEGWDKVMALNLKSPFFLAQALLPMLRAGSNRDNPASVINVGSVDGLRCAQLPTFSYSASKAALHHLTRVLASHLAAENINVNAVAPGPFESKMMAHTLATSRSEILAAVPRGRIGEPADMAGVALYLASRASAYVTGAVIPVDGGLLCRRG